MPFNNPYLVTPVVDVISSCWSVFCVLILPYLLSLIAVKSLNKKGVVVTRKKMLLPVVITQIFLVVFFYLLISVFFSTIGGGIFFGELGRFLPFFFFSFSALVRGIILSGNEGFFWLPVIITTIVFCGFLFLMLSTALTKFTKINFKDSSKCAAWIVGGSCFVLLFGSYIFGVLRTMKHLGGF